MRTVLAFSVGIVIATFGFATTARAQGGPSTPGETSGPDLAPLLVTDVDPTTGALQIVYQAGCGITNNNIYSGSLDQVSSMAFDAEVCGIGNDGFLDGYAPGNGSRFFVVVGNKDDKEGSYGEGRAGTVSLPRSPYSANTCGDVQDLSSPCAPIAEGSTCITSADCGRRQTCVESPAAGRQCSCLPPFDGTYCSACREGYAGAECRECEAGYYGNRHERAYGFHDLRELTDPERFECKEDVPGSCAGQSCSGNGTCVEAGRDATCACDEGYTGRDCAECAPDYQLVAGLGCVLDGVCRDAHCGGHGDCVATPFGDVTCSCDSGYGGVDCGGPDLAVRVDLERNSLYEGETVLLEPLGGSGPYTWQVTQGPATIAPCMPGGPCPPGWAELTVATVGGGITSLELIRVSLTDGLSNTADQLLAAIPADYVAFSGAVIEELVPYYDAMERYMRARGVRAAVLAISKGGKQVGVNGYGYRDAGIDADPFVHAGEGGPLVQPDSPFRLASVSKVLTAAAVRGAAVDAGANVSSASPANRASRWVTDSTGFSLTGGAPPYRYNLDPLTTDERWENVSLTHLLNHHGGHWRDVVEEPAPDDRPRWDEGLLPFTQSLIDPGQLQEARWGSNGPDIVLAPMYWLAALQSTFDPRPTVEKLIWIAAAVRLNYSPGANNFGNGDSYSNLGYVLLSRALEGLKGETYDDQEPGVPDGWGKFPDLVADYMCEASGVVDGVFPGDSFNPYPLEPYYRDLDKDGNELLAWNMEQGADKIRWNPGIQQWQFCQSGCPDNGAVWNDELNTPRTYGGVWLATASGAGGLVATASAVLRLARNHVTKQGAPNDSPNVGIGARLPAPAAHLGRVAHWGASFGTVALVWQLKGSRTTNLPDDTGAWNPDPSAPLDLDDDGKVIINENIVVSEPCDLPEDVALVAIINQWQDRRAPKDRNEVSGESSASSGWPVYLRLADFLAGATCEVDAEGWPAVANNPPVDIAVPCP